METKLLEDIGLTRSEALVYLALAGLGPSTTGKIIEKAGIASSKIYEILNKLEQKGLASHVVRTGVKEFEAAPPERILMYIEEKEKRLEDEKIRAEKLVALLKSKSTVARKEQEATIYKGYRGMKTVFYQCVKEMSPGSTFLVMGVPKRHEKHDKFFVRWNKFRAKRKVKLKIMFEENARRDAQANPANSPLSEIRFMPEEVLSPAAVNICNDKVIIFPAETEEDPLLILIRSKEIADSFRAQFQLLWRQNVKTFYGNEGPKYVMNDLIKYTGQNPAAFGLSEDKLNRHVPEELARLIRMQNEGKVKPPRLIFTGKTVPREIAKESRFRMLPEKFSTPFHYELYGSKVAIFYWIDPVITTVIENKTVAENFRKHFEAMWKMAKKKA